MQQTEDPLKNHLRLLETIARYEAVSKTANLRGSIAQIGVGNGFGLVTLAKLHDIVAPFSTGTLFFGFDTFTFYSNPEEDERSSVKKLESSSYNRFEGDLLDQVTRSIEEYSRISPFPQRTNSRFRLTVGPAEDTLDRFVAGGTRFKIVEIDVNLRAGTKKALQVFWPLLIPGGLLIFGGYSSNDWPGETEVVHQFLLAEKLRPMSFNSSTYPSSYVLKPWGDNG